MSVSMSWYAESLELENFRCFKHLTIDFDPSLTVLVGANGTGKTAALEAIAVMLSTVLREFDGPIRGFSHNDARIIPHSLDFQDSAAHMESQYPVAATLHGALNHQRYWWHRTRRSQRGKTTWVDKNSPVGRDMATLMGEAKETDEDSPILPALAYYGVERLVGVRRSDGPIPTSRSGAYKSALDGKSDLARLYKYIEALSFAEFSAERSGGKAPAATNQLRAMSLACNELLGTTGWRDPDWSPTAKEIVFTHPDHGTLPLSYLSSGIRIAAGLTLDLVSRMARANPHLGADQLLKTVPGIILIDEMDLHLHPTWQQRIIPLLRNIFPRIQFIITTHSPQVLSTVAAEHIRIIDGDQVRRVQYSEGLRSDIVLDHVLNTSPEPDQKINHFLEDYLQLVNKGEGLSTKALKLREKLDKHLGGVTNVPKLASADAQIAFYDLDL